LRGNLNRRKERIAVLHYSCPPVVGGVESVIAEHAKVFTYHGYKTKIIAGRGSKFDKHIKVEIIPELNSLYEENEIISSEIKECKVTEKFKELTEKIYSKLEKSLTNYGVCIIHNVLTMHFNMPFTAALHKLIKNNNKKFISWCHDHTFTKESFYENDIKKKYPYTLLVTRLKNVKYISVSSLRQKQIANLLSIPIKEVIKIPNGINPVSFLKIHPSTLKAFQKYRLFSADLIFLSPVRILKRKNIEKAIFIIKELKELGKKPKLIITGPPDPHNKESKIYYKTLKSLIKKEGLINNIIFLYECKFLYGKENNKLKKYLDFDFVRDFYLLSDALLFTSTQEGFGIPILEAGLINLPIICSNIPPFRELGSKSSVLFFKKNESPKRIAERTIILLEKTLNHSLFKRIVRRYLWDIIFKKKT